MMLAAPQPVRLSAYPYLLATVLYAAIYKRRDPAALAQKAHRLINKHSYKHEQLDSTAQTAFGTEIHEYLGVNNPFVCAVYIIESVVKDSPYSMGALDDKDAQYGKLRDFINHVLSKDE